MCGVHLGSWTLNELGFNAGLFFSFFLSFSSVTDVFFFQNYGASTAKNGDRKPEAPYFPATVLTTASLGRRHSQQWLSGTHLGWPARMCTMLPQPLTLLR